MPRKSIPTYGTIERYADLVRCANWIVSEWRRSDATIPTAPCALWSTVQRFILEYNEGEPCSKGIRSAADQGDVYRLIVSAISFDGISPNQLTYTVHQLANGLERIGHDPAHACGYLVPEDRFTAVYP